MVNDLAFKLFDKLRTRLQLVVGRAVLNAVSHQKGKQFVKATMLAGETHDGLEQFQQYGLYSVPLKGCEGIFVAVGGKRNASVCIATSDVRYEPQDKQAGEAGMFHYTGKLLRHREDQTELTTEKFVVETDELIITAGKVIINSDDISLGGEGGERLARVGDRVQVSSGSSIGLWPIIEGSEKVTSL